MAGRGRKKTPTAKLKLTGSWVAKTRPNEPQPEQAIPLVPKWLSRLAKTEWGRIAPLLLGAGLLAEQYQVPLALYCQAYADYLAARAIVQKEGMTSTTDKGNVIQHPAVGAMNKAWDRTLRAAVEFGMTPSSIAGTAVKKTTSGGEGKDQAFYIA